MQNRTIHQLKIKKEIPTFNKGTYEKPCELFPEIKIGSINCVGHTEISSIQKCKYCLSHKEEKTYHLEILKEITPIVSEVICNRPCI